MLIRNKKPILCDNETRAAQFKDKEWSLLIANEEFKKAWESDGFIKAGEIANPLINGKVDNVRDVKELKRLFDEYVNIPD